MKIIAFLDNKGGVGTTSLVYHLAWMFQQLGLRVLAADLDPQPDLTSMFLTQERLAALWPDGDHPLSVSGALRPFMRGPGDAVTPHIEVIAEGLGLIVGDLGLSAFEGRLAGAWSSCLSGDEAAFRTATAFYRLLRGAAQVDGADLVLIDVGPSLGAITRSALIAVDHIVVPLAPDHYSLQGVRELGPALRRWRREWCARLAVRPDADVRLPAGCMAPAGYVMVQNALRLARPASTHAFWQECIREAYTHSVLKELPALRTSGRNGPLPLAKLKHFRSLMPLAIEARKPCFLLRREDGAVGPRREAVWSASNEFSGLAKRIASAVGQPLGELIRG